MGASMFFWAIEIVYSFYKLENEGIKTTGTIIEMKRSSSGKGSNDYPVVRFTSKEGKKITFESNQGSNFRGVGAEVKVLYQQESPGEALIAGFYERYISPTILAIVGLAFAYAGTIFWRIFDYVEKRAARLLQQGRPVQARIINVKRNGPSGFEIICQWYNASTNEVHVFESDTISYDPTPYFKSYEITVYINPDEMKDYYVDIRFLPKKYNRRTKPA